MSKRRRGYSPESEPAEFIASTVATVTVSRDMVLLAIVTVGLAVMVGFMKRRSVA